MNATPEKLAYVSEWRKRNKDKVKVYSATWRTKNPNYGSEHARTNSSKYWERNLKRKYGLTVDAYFYMQEEQGGNCLICKSSDVGHPGQSKLHVDHCHSTGIVRGLLCTHCNRGLGAFKDSPRLLQSAIDYLVSFQQRIKA